MKECNECVNNYCGIDKKLTLIRKTGKGLSAVELQAECHRFIKSPGLKTPMLFLALIRNGQGVLDTLSELNMQIVEKGRKPYFDIV